MTFPRIGAVLPAGAAAIAVAIAACSSTSSPSSAVTDKDAGADSADSAPPCLSDLPQTCPTPIPDYQTQVQPILATYCVTCHSPTGCCGYSEVTYKEVYDQASSILDFAYMCSMPPPASPQLTTQERVTLLSWLVCVGNGNVGPDGGTVTGDGG